MPHVARAWRRRYEDDPDRVCLDFDVSNAYTLRAQRGLFGASAGGFPWPERLAEVDLPLDRCDHGTMARQAVGN